jgi:hypothetical protein
VDDRNRRPIRAYAETDKRLTFGDMVAKLAILRNQRQRRAKSGHHQAKHDLHVPAASPVGDAAGLRA